MRRASALLLVLAALLIPARASAAVYYAKVGGSGNTCQENTPCPISTGIGKLTTAGDVLELMSTGGAYETDAITITGKAGGSGNPMKIRGYKYGQAGAQRPVITGAGTVTWSTCTSCDGSDNVACQGLPGTPATCSQYQYYYGSGTQSIAINCTKADGTPCFRVATKGEMTNAHAGFKTGACGFNPSIVCSTSSDCPVLLEACTPGVVTEVDSYSSGSYIVARFGSVAPGGVLHNNNGNGFDIRSSSWFTFQGLFFRNFRRAALLLNGTVGAISNVGADDCWFAYSFDTVGNGSDYQLNFQEVASGFATGNYFAYSTSESIHSGAFFNEGSASALNIDSNFIRDNGDTTVLGTASAGTGTPEGITLTVVGLGSNFYVGGGNYVGTQIKGNVIRRVGKNGIIIENNFHGSSGSHVPISGNIIDSPGKNAISFACDGQTAGAFLGWLDVFDNIFSGANQSFGWGSGEGGLAFSTPSSGCTTHDIWVFNNTLPNSKLTGIVTGATSNVTNVIVRNNLVADYAWTVGKKLISWAMDPADAQFQNNLLWAPAAGLADTIAQIGTGAFKPTGGIPAWGPTADMDGDAAADGNLYGDPKWPTTDIAAGDFRLRSDSPAIDGGTMTGMPTRTGIHNTIAAAHGLPDYTRLQSASISSSPDIGAWESVLKDGDFESGSIDGPWIVPIRDLSNICTAPIVFDYSCASGAPSCRVPVYGNRSLQFTVGPCLDSLCFSCRTKFAYEALSGLVTARRYTLSGRFRVLAGGLTAVHRVDILDSPDLPNTLSPETVPGCSLQITGQGNMEFVCPNVFTATGSTANLAIYPSTTGGAATMVLDYLDLR